MPGFKFGVRSIPSSPEGDADQTDYWDETVPGFGMRVSKGGTRTWVVMYRYNGTKRRMKIGTYPNKSLADARDEARNALRLAEDGKDPAGDKRQLKIRMDTVADLAIVYIEQHAKRNKRSWKKDEQILNREVLPVIGRMRVTDVQKSDVRRVLAPIIDRGAPIRANHTLEIVRKMYNWHIQENDAPIINPAAGITKPGKSNSRTRYLSDDEFKAFWKALTPERLGVRGVAAFQLIALTMQREMEVLRMRWKDIDWKESTWTIPENHAKNELEHVVPLGKFSMRCLRMLKRLSRRGETYVFPSEFLREKQQVDTHVRRVFVEKRIIKIREAAELIDVTIHDLRRSGTTYMSKLKVPQHIKKKLLNHVKRNKADVTDIYDRFEYLEEKREAMVKWESFLLEMVEEPMYAGYDDPNVITLYNGA